MAKITITIEDVGSNVKMEVKPTAAELYQKLMQQGHEKLSPSEAYALFIVNQVRAQSKAVGGAMKLMIPRVKGSR